MRTQKNTFSQAKRSWNWTETEVDLAHRRVGELKNKVKVAEEDSEKQKNTVSDMETNIGKLETEQARLRAENMKIREQLKERDQTY